MSSSQQPIGSGFHRTSEPGEVLAEVDLTGRTAVVTGGYSGIGLETTRALASKGAEVIVPVRTPAKAADALAGIDGQVRSIELDLADLASVRRATALLLAELDAIDLLINNAGIMATPEGRVGPGWERQFGTNHLGHMAWTLDLLPLVRAASSPRVVQLSSSGHKRSDIRWDDPHFDAEPYDKWAAYGQSKTANSLFAVALDRRLADDGGHAYAVHPGGIFTPLQRDLTLEEQVELGWRNADGTPSDLAQAGFKSPTQGCATTLWAATSPQLADIGGVYCEDTDVAPLAGPDLPPFLGVAAYAVDPDAAERLWALSERTLSEA